MRSKNWSFNKTLFFKNCSRFWPLWTTYLVIWLLALPGQFFVDMVDAPRGAEHLLRFAQRDVLNAAEELGLVLAVIFGLLCALAVFSYLFFPRAAGLMHTLPIRREGLFVTNYLSGLSFLWLPLLLTAGVLAAVEAAAGVLVLENILIWLAATGGMSLFFYSFAVLCAMLTGNILAMPALYAVFNGVILGLQALINELIVLFSFGYVSSEAFSSFAEWCTPIQKLGNDVRLEYLRDAEHNITGYLFHGGEFVAIYAGVGLVFTLLALLLYRRRHIESAGDVIAVGWAKPIFKYGFAFCAALCGSWVLYYLLFRVLLPTDFLALLVPLLLCSVLGYFVAEMLLQKSFKVFRKGWFAALIFTSLLGIGLFGLSRDIFGFETQIPEVEEIDQIYFQIHSTPPYDEVNALYRTFPAEETQRLEAIHLIHRTVIENRKEYKLIADQVIPFDGDRITVELSYTLKDGSSLRRRYHLPVRMAGETAPAVSLEGRLLSLLRDPDLMTELYFDELDFRVGGARLDVYNPETGKMDLLTIEDPADLKALYAAVRSDIAAGRLGIRYLSDFDPARRSNCAANDLRLDLLYDAVDPATGKEYTDTRNVDITLQYTAEETLRVLAELGAFTETRTLISYGEQHEADYPPEYWLKYEMPYATVEEFTGTQIILD